MNKATLDTLSEESGGQRCRIGDRTEAVAAGRQGRLGVGGLPEELDAMAPLPMPQVCLVTLEEMLAPEPGAENRRLMAQLIVNGLRRELLWKLTHGWPPPALSINNLDDPAVPLLVIRPAEVVDSRLQATQAATIEAQEL